MAYIRERSEERTGYQASARLYGKIDFQCDFIMCYGVNDTTADRIAAAKENGYVVHLMTGIAWGGYVDYLDGKWDNREHWDESQTDRYGNPILHGEKTPYMVPTVSFADYLSERLKIAVDAGVEAIHVEEPEFWDRGGYSEAFKREYLLFYKEPWMPPHTDFDTRYKSAQLKAYLYKRTIERVSAYLKEYALTKYNRVLRFYVPTHSLLNYTQWKIMSPEGSLAQSPAVDGFIAQIWTGTSREPNCYEGVIKERTFETAYLEYGVMQELVKGTGKRMWFLHDPIEDNPIFDWNDYRCNYFKTVTASLLHPRINHYEICPWPNRVFDGTYPKNSPEAISIPEEYATLLNNNFQTLGDVECCEPDEALRVGVLISDSALYQRDFPDCANLEVKERVGTVLVEEEDKIKQFENLLFKGKGTKEMQLEFIRSNAFPQFYGLCLPLLKHGIPVRPVLLDNAGRYPGYLDDCDALVLSYEFIKPDSPDLNTALASWVRSGGILIYVGDGTDPYHSIRSWWSNKYASPAEHLFEALEIAPENEKEIFSVSAGAVGFWKITPATLCYSKENADRYREFFTSVLASKGKAVEKKNHLIQRRGAYISAAVFDESFSDEPLVLNGLFADMYTPEFDIITQKSVAPDKNTLLFDLEAIGNEPRIIGTSARIFSLSDNGGEIALKARGASDFKAYIRVRVPHPCSEAVSDSIPVSCEYDEKSKTVLLGFDSNGTEINITIK